MTLSSTRSTGSEAGLHPSRVGRHHLLAAGGPAAGIGKPELLKYGIGGSWSRRITDEHRLVYQVLNEDLVVLQARYNYGT